MAAQLFSARARPAGRARFWFRVRHLLPALGLLACGPAPADRTPALTDDLGRALGLQEPARRIVSLAPSHTELLFAVGAGDRVVGRTQWCTDPPAALAVPSVGDGLNPNVEAIAARRPDLVLAYASAANAAATEQLARLGIPVFNLRMDQLDDVSRAARLIELLTGVPAGAAADRFAARLDSARRAPRASGPTVLLLAWDQPPIVIGGGSFQSEIAELAGGRNVFADLAAPSAQVSIETIAARNPDVIVVTGGADPPAWARRPEWQVVPAVRAGRFVTVTGSAFGRPSFRAFDAVDTLRAALAAVRR